MDYFLNAITEGTMKSFVIGKGYCIPSSSTTTTLVNFMEYPIPLLLESLKFISSMTLSFPLLPPWFLRLWEYHHQDPLFSLNLFLLPLHFHQSRRREGQQGPLHRQMYRNLLTTTHSSSPRLSLLQGHFMYFQVGIHWLAECPKEDFPTQTCRSQYWFVFSLYVFYISFRLTLCFVCNTTTIILKKYIKIESFYSINLIVQAKDIEITTKTKSSKFNVQDA